ncbi:Predicted DNA-binding transcriptional regulator YafY, contains an HTH and WYL domains [Marinobacter sp. DSM 26671]|uniref:helix-turn-helix transcriptional regulator n=1 Tax=Marinobacter sp. DSM 26671 TaxID=1761793 RepID=UPI0008ED2CF9|nr:WYL domain-containing transcriptional regulator [Marinobacter sp. DSM 26671]SFF05052.1 Predicted DNA-binding transcriptional regulator YafY, contains an HTH and WYL domains [Marinobacter sp. DSM 26671]
MSETAIRYLTMLRLVPRYPGTITTTELAERLSDREMPVTKRSIQRDLEKLSAFFPLVVDAECRPFRWSFERDAALDLIPALDLPAALTFELAHAYLRPILPPRALSHLKPHFDAAQRILARERSGLGGWPDKVRVINRGLDSHMPEVETDVLETVTEALLREFKCKLVYKARNWPQPEEILVNPLGLVFRDPNVYLIGTIEGREGIRQLVLHRSSEGRLLKKPVERPDGFDLDLYIASGAMGILHSDKPVFLHLRCDKPVLNHLAESPLGFDQVMTDIDENSFDVKVTVGDTQDLRWWLTAQAMHLDIIEPIWLRREICANLANGQARNKEMTSQEMPLKHLLSSRP